MEYVSFFFSSRRRHTRYIGDWSSDVCSSDLENIIGKPLIIYWSYDAPTDALADPSISMDHIVDLVTHFPTKTRWRSEERRVGKESRSRWWTYEYKRRSSHVHKEDRPTRCIRY